MSASIERASEHPLAAAIIKGAEEKGLTLLQTEDFQSATGQGVVGEIKSHRIGLGNRTLMNVLGINVEVLMDHVNRLRKKGQTVMFVGIDGKSAGIIGVADPIKASTPRALKAFTHDCGGCDEL